MDRTERREHDGGFTGAVVRRVAGAAESGSTGSRHLHKGFGDSLALAFELAVTPAVFAGLGWMLDRRLGTSPLFLVVFFVVVFAYLAWKQFVRYDADMNAQHDKLFGRRDEPPGPAPGKLP